MRWKDTLNENKFSLAIDNDSRLLAKNQGFPKLFSAHLSLFALRSSILTSHYVTAHPLQIFLSLHTSLFSHQNTHFSLFTPHYSFLIQIRYCSFVIAHFLLLTMHCLLLTLTFHSSLLTTLWSLLISPCLIHFSIHCSLYILFTKITASSLQTLNLYHRTLHISNLTASHSSLLWLLAEISERYWHSIRQNRFPIEHRYT